MVMVESEVHFICEFSSYNDLRQVMNNKYIFFHVNATMTDTFELVMSTNCSTFICQAWDRRNEYLYSR